MAFGLAVYASPSSLPHPTQNSLPVAGQALLDGIHTRKVPLKGFKVVDYILSPFPKLPWRNRCNRRELQRGQIDSGLPHLCELRPLAAPDLLWNGESNGSKTNEKLTDDEERGKDPHIETAT